MDIFLALSVALVQSVLAVGGFAVSLDVHKDYKIGRKSLFMFFGGFLLIGFVLTAWAGVRAYYSGEDSKKIQLGDSVHPPFVDIVSLPTKTRFVVTNGSEFPSYGVIVSMADDADPSHPIKYEYNEIPAHVARVDDKPWIPDSAPLHHFTILINTRAGSAREELYMRPSDNNQWMRALNVVYDGHIVEAQSDSQWPRDERGVLIF